MKMQNGRFISDRSMSVDWSGIRIVSARLGGMGGNAISLAVGQPDFATPSHIRRAAKEALDQGYTRYPPSKGFEDLRQAIAEKLKTKNGIQANPNSEIFISIGAMQSIFTAILVLVQPGDEVIVLDPGFIYDSQIRLFGGVPVPVAAREENRFKIDPDDIGKAVTSKTRLIILNTPSNPTGALFDRASLNEIAKIAQESGIFVLSDEAYEDIVFDGDHVSIGSFPGMEDLTVSVFTFSKSYAMTGWRVGYVAARREIIDEMEKLMEHMCSGVTAVSQRAALAALQGPQKCISDMVAEYGERRKRVCESLGDVDGLSFSSPEGTFYIYVNISGTKMKSWDLVDYLIEKQKVGTIPGNAFGQNGAEHIRISFASDRKTLMEGISRIKQGIEDIQRHGPEIHR